MDEQINRQELRVIGMSRSGNHAILNWIIQQAEGRLCFLNCTEPQTNPFESARPMGDGQPYRANYADFHLPAERRGRFSRKDWLIHSHEDCFLGKIVRGEFEEHHDRYVGPSGRRREALILRDPFNLFASRSVAQYALITERTSLRIWKQHAREFLGRRRYLPADRLAISYNRWVLERDYRRRIAAELGLTFTDTGVDHVPRTGSGSSFDGLDYDGRATRMDLFRRWEAFADDRRFLRLFDDEMLELSEAIFGTVPGTEPLLERLGGR